ncbi:MAG: hypothetical protein FWB74_02170 [Defluviitaleaceae bacterium]|nr:hypothetical protein [Defluviitaleaceae bacterium]
MKLLYGTTNKSKIEFMQKRVEHLGIEVLCLNDIGAPKIHIEENGSSPLENARIKARAYFEALNMPVFSADSGLYIDGLADARQPGLNVRGDGDWMTDDDAIAHYCALAKEMGGRMTARYKNAICLILADGTVHEYMGDDIASTPFYMVDVPHHVRHEGFPLDSLSVSIKTGLYYHDMDNNSKYAEYSADYDGFTKFFERIFVPSLRA